MLAFLTAWCFFSGLVHADPTPLYLRNQSPFLQVFGLPGPEGGNLAPAGTLKTTLAIALANHANNVETADETLVLDGESYSVDAVLRYGLGERWEVGVDLPYVAHRKGKFDNLIEGWHDLFGFSNLERDGASNQLQFTYQRNGTTEARLDDSGSGIGDVRLTGAYQLLRGGEDAPSLALRGMVKLPTGNEDHLRGSGASDVAMSLEATKRQSLAGRSLDLFAQAGALRLGDGQVLADQQKRSVPFGSLALRWQWTETIDLRAQLAVQGAYFDSGLDELGGTTSSLTVGGGVLLRGLGLKLDIAVVEDLISDATPDFGMYISVRPIGAGHPR